MSHFYFKEELYPDSYAEASWTPLGLAPSESVSANSSHLHQNHQHQHFYQQLQPPTNQPPSSTRQKFQFVESWLPPVSSAHPVSPSKAAAILPFSRHQYPVSTPPPPPPLPIVPSRAAPAGPPQLPNYPSPPHLASGPFLGGEDPAYSLGSHQFHQPSASLPVYPLRSVMVGTERDHPSYATHPAEVVSVLSNSPPPSFSSAQHTPSWQHSADPASRNHSSGDYCGHAPLPRSQQVFQPSELSSLPVSPASYVFSPLPPSASNGHPHNGGVSSYEASRHFPSRESYQLVQPACGPAASNALPPYVVGSNNTYSANTCSGYYYGYQSGSVQPRPAQPFDRNEYIHLTLQPAFQAPDTSAAPTEQYSPASSAPWLNTRSQTKRQPLRAEAHQTAPSAVTYNTVPDASKATAPAQPETYRPPPAASLPGQGRKRPAPAPATGPPLEVIDLTISPPPPAKKEVIMGPPAKKRRAEVAKFSQNSGAAASPLTYQPMTASVSSTSSRKIAVASQLRSQKQVATIQPPSQPTYDDKEGHYIVVENEDLTPRYKILRLLGQGTFGKVVEAYDRTRKERVAIKIIRAVQKYRDASRVEIRVLQTLKERDPMNTKRCIHLVSHFDFRNHVCMVFELLAQSIFDYLKDNHFQPFPTWQIQEFAHQIVEAVQFLHGLGLIHTDLKPENLMLQNTNSVVVDVKDNRPRKELIDTRIKLIDFGSAIFETDYHSSVVSTRHYRAPEIIMGLGWSSPCDMWSIGCILVELFTGDALFQTHDNLEHLAMMEVVLGKLPDSMIRSVPEKGHAKGFFKDNGQLQWPNPEASKSSRKYVKSLQPLASLIRPHDQLTADFLDLVKRLLTYEPNKRMTASQALAHPFFVRR